MNDAFRLLFDQVKSGIVWVQRDGIVRYANKAAVQLTPCMLGRPFLDPTIARTLKAAGEDLLRLPFEFEFQTDEAQPDTVRAVVIPAPVGKDLMLVLNNVSEERWYSQALENLIHYLETEMARPIQTLLAELPVLVRGAGHDAAAHAAREFTDKLGKLRELATVFGAGPMTRDERILVTPLVRHALAGLSNLVDEQRLTLTFEGFDTEPPAVYGSELWLRRAMAEYVEHVLRKARNGSTVEISVQSIGTRVLLRSRNKGLFVTNHQRRSSFVPFEAGDAKAPAHSGIGLALARYIVEQHGGAVRIEDEFDEVDFVLELPAGAPATQDAQLSVQQAQRYAHDMAQLMARRMARQPKEPASKP